MIVLFFVSGEDVPDPGAAVSDGITAGAQSIESTSETGRGGGGLKCPRARWVGAEGSLMYIHSSMCVCVCVSGRRVVLKPDGCVCVCVCVSECT